MPVFVWFMALVVLVIDVAAIVDVIRRRDLSVVAAAVWIVLLLVLPVLGVIVYLIARPSVVGDDDNPEEAKRAVAEAAERERERESEERLEELR